MDGEERPAYLITANALVWRPALFRIGGFDERFQSAGGEDIDLGLRLWERGALAYAPSAQVLHVFDAGSLPSSSALCGMARGIVVWLLAIRRISRLDHLSPFSLILSIMCSPPCNIWHCGMVTIEHSRAGNGGRMPPFLPGKQMHLFVKITSITIIFLLRNRRMALSSSSMEIVPHPPGSPILNRYLLIWDV